MIGRIISFGFLTSFLYQWHHSCIIVMCTEWWIRKSDIHRTLWIHFPTVSTFWWRDSSNHFSLTMSNPVEQVPVSAVSLKLPPFWTEQPEAWFVESEAQFALRKITSSLAKFYHVTAFLPQETIVSVLDIVRKSLRDIESVPQPIVRHGWLPASRTASQLTVVGRPPSLTADEHNASFATWWLHSRFHFQFLIPAANARRCPRIIGCTTNQRSSRVSRSRRRILGRPTMELHNHIRRSCTPRGTSSSLSWWRNISSPKPINRSKKCSF